MKRFFSETKLYLRSEMKLNEANFFYSETTEAKLFLNQNFRNKTLFLAKWSETFFVVLRNWSET